MLCLWGSNSRVLRCIDNSWFFSLLYLAIVLYGLTYFQDLSIGNHILSSLSPAVSPLKVKNIDSVLIEAIIFIVIHLISCYITQEILQTTQEVEYLKQNSRQRYCRSSGSGTLNQNYRHKCCKILNGYFLNQNYRQRYCKILRWCNFKPKLQAKILQNPQEVEYLKKPQT